MGAKIVLLHQHHAPAASGQIAGDAHAIDAAADHQDVAILGAAPAALAAGLSFPASGDLFMAFLVGRRLADRRRRTAIIMATGVALAARLFIRRRSP